MKPDELLDAYLDGELTEEQAAELVAWLKEDEANIDRLIRAANRDDALRGLLSPVAAETDAPAAATRRPSSRRRRRASGVRPAVRRRGTPTTGVLVLAGAIAAAVIVALTLPGRTDVPHHKKRREPGARPVATRPATGPVRPVEALPEPTDDDRALPGDEHVVDASPDAGDVTAPAPMPVAETDAAADEPARVADVEPPAPEAAPAPGVATSTPPAPALVPQRKHVAYLDRTDGDVEFSPAGGATWSPARAGLALVVGDRLATKHALARVTYESGTALYLNHWTVLTVEVAEGVNGLHLERGAVYIETAKRDTGYYVATDHGRAVDLGTRFGVESKKSGTTVTVIEGGVRASTEAGAIELAADQSAHLARRVAPPRRLRDGGAEARVAWAVPMIPARPVVLYVFDEGEGAIVRDVGGAGEPLNLKVADPTRVRWRPDGISIVGSTVIVSERPAQKLYDRICGSNAFTVEAWITTPKFATEYGPDRVVSLSRNIVTRNFTLGQGGYGDVAEQPIVNCRLRVSQKAFMPFTSPPVLAPGRRVHLVWTHAANGASTLFVNGKPVVKARLPGNFAKHWHPDLPLALANEPFRMNQAPGTPPPRERGNQDRSWLGTYHRLAIYDRALRTAEVKAHHDAGVRP